LGLISEEEDTDQVVFSRDQGDLENIPAFSLPKEKQTDTAYPNFRFFTMGLCSKILGPGDTAFASIRGATTGNHAFFCPLPFDNMDESMVLLEEDWRQSSEHAKRYRVG
jgi:hypothetical protein